MIILDCGFLSWQRMHEVIFSAIRARLFADSMNFKKILLPLLRGTRSSTFTEKDMVAHFFQVALLPLSCPISHHYHQFCNS
jgi:hypothetical protein